MADGTAIEWTDDTWNPLVGCTRCTDGCDNCYAITSVHRGAAMGVTQHIGLTAKPAPDEPLDWTGAFNMAPQLLDKYLRKTRPRSVFVNSLSDMFHRDAVMLPHPDTRMPYIAEIIARMAATPQHTYQVLTKRPQNMASVLGNPAFRLDVNAILMRLGFPVMPGGMSDPDFRWPSNIQWGTSIELNKYAFRANYLRKVNGTRFISAEPLLGPLTDLDLTGIDWVIAGGESGNGARPMHPDWARHLRDLCQAGYVCECVARGPVYSGANWTDDPDGSPDECPVCDFGAVRVPFLFKQWGKWGPAAEGDAGASIVSAVDGTVFSFRDPIPPEHRPNAARMRSADKHLTGRLLDGRTWDEYPTVNQG